MLRSTATWTGAVLLTALGTTACGSSAVSFETTTAWVHSDADSIPLDAAFMDENGVILEILAMEPCESPDPEGCPEYTPGAPYRFALEVNRGWFARNGVGVGARVTLEGGPEGEVPPPDPLPTDGPTAAPPDPEDPFFLHPRLLEQAELAAQDPDLPFEPGATSWEFLDDLPFPGALDGASAA